MRDYVDHGTTGLLVTPGDQQCFADALVTLLSEPDRCREMGLRAREQVELRFNTVAQAGRLADLLREAADDG
jgi:glycosyltransferase involved in cell wall biosynthesis